MFTFLKTKAGLCVVKSTFKLGHAIQTFILKFISKHFIKEGGGGVFKEFKKIFFINKIRDQCHVSFPKYTVG